MKTEKQLVGVRGEAEACSYLTGLGHRILRRNWRAGHLELDIITLQGRILHFVEVKTRRGGSGVAPETKVDRTKRERLVRAANAFLNARDRACLPADLEVQFDILTVVFEEPVPVVEYYPQAFIPMYV
ncbi:MAG: YraN family protein [Bacteroidales bacterium]|nr:YraN family protein [Bacteroidales bacterium]